MSSASRKSVVSALVRYASSSSRSRPKPRPSGGAPAAGVSDPNQLVPGSPTSSSSLQDSSSSSDTWVEVRDPKSNQIYYWNRSTSERCAYVFLNNKTLLINDNISFILSVQMKRRQWGRHGLDH